MNQMSRKGFVLVSIFHDVLTEAVSLLNLAPATQHEVSAQVMLQRARQMLVEDRVQVIVVCNKDIILRFKTSKKNIVFFWTQKYM